MQAVVNQYTAVFETQERAEVGAAQVNLSDRNLKIASARLAARNATQLDVNRAQNTLATDRQELANARAQLPVLEAQLVRTLGLPAGTNVTVTAPPTPPRLTATSAALARGVDTLPSVIGAAQAVESATLQVRLADNDYTPRRTLEDARVSLANAQRDLDTARRAAQTALRDAERAVSDATERVTLARQALANARTNLTQTETRFRNGTAASVDVQTARVSTQNAELNLTVATDTLWKALAALSVASGQDVTGLVGSGGDQ